MPVPLEIDPQRTRAQRADWSAYDQWKIRSGQHLDRAPVLASKRFKRLTRRFASHQQEAGKQHRQPTTSAACQRTPPLLHTKLIL